MSASRKRRSAPRLSAPSDRQIRAGVRSVAGLPRGLRRALALLLVVVCAGGRCALGCALTSGTSALPSMIYSIRLAPP